MLVQLKLQLPLQLLLVVMMLVVLADPHLLNGILPEQQGTGD